MSSCDTLSRVIMIDLGNNPTIDLTFATDAVMYIHGELGNQVTLTGYAKPDGFSITIVNAADGSIGFRWDEESPRYNFPCINGEFRTWYDIADYVLPSGRSIVLKGLPLTADETVNRVYSFGYMDANF